MGWTGAVGKQFLIESEAIPLGAFCRTLGLSAHDPLRTLLC
jgi:hypothetical protein